MSFNLVKNPWIPCVYKSGDTKEESLESVLEKAGEIVAVWHQSPLVTAAIHRHLVTLVAAAGGIEDSRFHLLSHRPPTGALAYARASVGKFDLFGPRPFMQVHRQAGTDFEVSKADPPSRLCLEKASLSKKLAFDQTFDENCAPMLPAEAARQLLAMQTFCVGTGGQTGSNLFGKHPTFFSSNAFRSLVAVATGSSLAETIGLNLPDPTPGDAPSWEVGEFKPGSRAARGPLDLLTYRPRCVRLVEEGGMVARVFVAPGEDALGPDPMAPTKKIKGEEGPLRPDSRPWEALAGILDNETTPEAFRRPGQSPAGCDMYAVYPVKFGSAEIRDWNRTSYSLRGHDDEFRRLVLAELASCGKKSNGLFGAASSLSRAAEGKENKEATRRGASAVGLLELESRPLLAGLSSRTIPPDEFSDRFSEAARVIIRRMSMARGGTGAMAMARLT
jgi:hypothetical protein